MILDHELQKKVVQKDNVQNLQKCVILSSLSLDTLYLQISYVQIEVAIWICHWILNKTKRAHQKLEKLGRSWKSPEYSGQRKVFFFYYENFSIIFPAISISIIPSNHVDIDDDIDDDIKYDIINDLTMTLTMTRRRRDKKRQHGSDGASRARIVLINQNRSNSEPKRASGSQSVSHKEPKGQ